MPKERSLPLPLKYFDVVRRTNTTLDVLLESCMDDYRNVDGGWELSGPWTGFTQFSILNETPPDGFLWSRRRLTKVQATSRPDYLWPKVWSKMSQSYRKADARQCSKIGERPIVRRRRGEGGRGKKECPSPPLLPLSPSPGMSFKSSDTGFLCKRIPKGHLQARGAKLNKTKQNKNKNQKIKNQNRNNNIYYFLNEIE